MSQTSDSANGPVLSRVKSVCVYATVLNFCAWILLWSFHVAYSGYNVQPQTYDMTWVIHTLKYKQPWTGWYSGLSWNY